MNAHPWRGRLFALAVAGNVVTVVLNVWVTVAAIVDERWRDAGFQSFFIFIAAVTLWGLFVLDEVRRAWMARAAFQIEIRAKAIEAINASGDYEVRH